jgi:WD40 repeat protein
MKEHEYTTPTASVHQRTGAKRRKGYLSLSLLALLSLLFLGSSLAIVPDVAAATQERRKPGTTIFTYQRQPNGIYSLDWSPDGKRLLSTSKDGQSWDATTGRQVKVYEKPNTYSGSILSAEWSPDGKRVALAGDEIYLFDAASGKYLRSLKFPNSRPSNDGATVIRAISWSPDGKYIASTTRADAPNEGLVVLWDVGTGKIIASLSGHSSTPMSLSWSPDGKHLASASFDGTVRVWQVAAGKTIYIYTGHQSGAPLRSVAWSPDGRSLAAASANGEVHIWGFGVQVVKYKAPSALSLAWSPDSKRLAIGGEGVQIINPANGKLLFTYRGQPTAVNAVDWSPDGKYLASADAPASPARSTVKVWPAQ